MHWATVLSASTLIRYWFVNYGCSVHYPGQVLYSKLLLQCTVPWSGTVLSTMAAVYSTLIGYCIVNYCFTVQYIDQVLYCDQFLRCEIPLTVSILWAIAASYSTLFRCYIVNYLLPCTVPWSITLVNYFCSVQFLDQVLYCELLLQYTVPWSGTILWTIAAVYIIFTRY